MEIASGFRCPRQNELAGGRPFSQHLVGLAADIVCTTDSDRFELVRLLLNFGFRRIGIGRRIVHADIATVTGPLIWTYYTVDGP